jgi:hypothetical protein
MHAYFKELSNIPTYQFHFPPPSPKALVYYTTTTTTLEQSSSISSYKKGEGVERVKINLAT